MKEHDLHWWIGLDSDTIYNPPTLGHLLTHHDPEKKIVIGCVKWHWEKWIVYGGCGMIFSRPLVECLIKTLHEGSCQTDGWPLDVWLSICAHDCDAEFINV